MNMKANFPLMTAIDTATGTFPCTCCWQRKNYEKWHKSPEQHQRYSELESSSRDSPQTSSIGIMSKTTLNKKVP